MAKLPAITPQQVERAMYIDFEGTMKDPPSMLGVLTVTDGEVEFDQPVFEEALWPAARYAPPNTEGYATKPAELMVTLTELRDKATNERRQIFAFSEHELNEITKALSSDDEIEWWKTNLINVRPYAKRWAKQAHPNYTFKKSANPMGGKHTLDQFLQLAGYEVPKMHGPGNSAQRIKYVRNQLVKKNGNWSALTRVAKGKWTKAMRHNWHDCYGTYQLMKQVTAWIQPRSEWNVNQ